MSLKVCILISSLIIGGAEKQTISLINNIDNVDIYLISLGTDRTLIDEVNLQKIKGVEFLNKKSRLDIFPLVKKINKVLKNINPDVVYCVNLYPLLFAFLVKNIFRQHYKLIPSIHTTIFRNKYSLFIFKWLYKPILNSIDHIIFVSRHQKNYWQNIYGVRNAHTVVIHNGIDLDKFVNFSLSLDEEDSLRKEINISKNELLLCMCTALRPEKNHLLAVSALKKIREKNIPAKLLIIGDGPMRIRIENAIYHAKLENKIILLGSKKDIRPYVKISDIFLLTSSTETFSIAVLEAMALGKPVIAPDIGGLSEQIFHKRNGFLFKPNDVNELVDYVIKIYKEKLINEMGKESLRIVKQFDSKLMAKKYKQLFEYVSTQG